MSSDVYADIEIALQTILNNISSHPYIEWENEKPYEPHIPTLYWRVTNEPAEAQRMSCGVERMHPGIFKIDVYCPRDLGTKILIDNLTLIDNAYNLLLPIYKNDTKISVKPFRGNSNHEPAWLHGSVKVKYVGYN